MASLNIIINEHRFEQTPGNSEGQGSLVCCRAWGLREFNTIEELNNNKYVISNKSK